MKMFPEIVAIYRQHLVERKHALWARFIASGYRDHEAHRLFLVAYVQLQKAPK